MNGVNSSSGSSGSGGYDSAKSFNPLRKKDIAEDFEIRGKLSNGGQFFWKGSYFCESDALVETLRTLFDVFDMKSELSEIQVKNLDTGLQFVYRDTVVHMPNGKVYKIG